MSTHYADATVEVLRDELKKPFATSADLADALDVSLQTIHNNADQLRNDPRIRSENVGQSDVYWLTVDMNTEGNSKRPYVALASDGDQVKQVNRDEAFEWADEHLAMLESLEPEGIDHWVQISSYRPSFDGQDGDQP